VSPPRVLVVEDDPNVRGLLDTLLTAEGYAVSTAGDGIAALATAASDPPALLVLDVVMPDLGGLQVLEELEHDPVLSAVPVVVVTGLQGALPDLRARLGSDSVFLKPFGVLELLARVAELTGGPR
jgi:DNA-binding response OmpR family regulator